MSLAATPVLVLAFLLPVSGGAQRRPEPNTCAPARDADYLERAFAENYGIFRQKGLDWRAISNVHAPRVRAAASCREEFALVGEWLETLNDHHVFVWNGDSIARSGTVIPADTAKFSLHLVRSRYLRDAVSLDSGRMVFGWAGDGTAYVHLADFYGDSDRDAARFDSMLAFFRGAERFIVDVRNHEGGYDRTVQLLASRFADRPRLYLQSRAREGTRPDAFSPPRFWQIVPHGGTRITAPVALLVGSHTMSAAENFTLAMRVLPNVAVLGERTAGVFADIYTDHLPGGWQIAIPYTEHLDHLDRSWEGVGLVPDVHVSNRASEVRAGRDRVLELALDLLRQPTSAAGDSASAAMARPQATAAIARRLRQLGPSAIGQADTIRGSPDLFPGVEAEYVEESRRLEHDGLVDEAVAMVRFATRIFVSPWRSYERLAELHARNDPTAARVAYRRALEIIPRHNAMLVRRATRIQTRLAALHTP